MFMQSTLKGTKTRPNRRASSKLKKRSLQKGLREIISGRSSGSGGSSGQPVTHGKRSTSGGASSSRGIFSFRKGAPVNHGSRPMSHGTRSAKSEAPVSHGTPASHSKRTARNGAPASHGKRSARNGAPTSHGKRTARNGAPTSHGKRSARNGAPTNHGRRKKQEGTSSLQLPTFTPWKLILTTVLAGLFGLLYITHVFSTQRLLEDVQVLEQEVNRITRIHAERRLAYDRMIGPKEIYQRAQERGFVNAGPADQVIKLER